LENALKTTWDSRNRLSCGAKHRKIFFAAYATFAVKDFDRKVRKELQSLTHE